MLFGSLSAIRTAITIFPGTYDGGDYIISNAVSTGKLDEDGQATAGIFGCVMDGSVSNLHVRNADFTASGDESYGPAGGVTGIAYGATIENCTVENSRVESERMPDDSTCAGRHCRIRDRSDLL